MNSENIELNDYIREYLKYNGFSNTLECLDAELRTKQVSNKLTSKNPLGNSNHQKTTDDVPRLYSLVRSDKKGGKDPNLEKEHKSLQKKYAQILQAARQIFSVSVSCLQLLHNLKEVSRIIFDITLDL